MSELRFRGNRRPTLGVEIELQIVDARTMELKSGIGAILADLPTSLCEFVKPEFLQCYVEINTGVCRTVDDLEADLAPKVRAVERIADRHGLRLAWAATHPFSGWREQEITPDDRYYKLAELLRETVVRPVTFGLHVHVGVESGDRAIQISHRLQRELPILLAISANSPFWHGRDTGHQSHRIEVLEGIPTGGLMPPLHSWSEYLELLDRMQIAGFVESHREFWWDVRPSAENGTIEVRICDMPTDLPDVLGLSAMIQCLVQWHSDRLDHEDHESDDPHPMMLRSNRWRAARFGLEARLVGLDTMEPTPARHAAEAMIRRLEPVADRLGCRRSLAQALQMTVRPTGADRQLELYRETGDLVEMVRRMSGRSRLSAEPDVRGAGFAGSRPYSAVSSPSIRW